MEKKLPYRELRALRQKLIAALDAEDAEAAGRLVVRYPEGDALAGEDAFLLGRFAELLQDTGDAERLYRAALASDGAAAWCRGAAAGSLAALLRRTARSEEALPYLRQSLACKTLASGWLEECSNYLLYAHDTVQDDAGRAALFELAKAYGARLAVVPKYDIPPSRRHEKIRVGYVSADFCRHVVAFFAYAMIRAYDHRAFEVFCYMNGPEDEVSAEYRTLVDGWRNVAGQSYAEVAQQIYDDEIDILFDLGGHTKDNLLPVFAYRPAPIQISGIGYFDTTGLAEMDYFLADCTTLPEGDPDEAHFTENILRMEHSHLCYMWYRAPSSPGPLPAGKNGFVTFGSLNNFAKASDFTLRLWAQVLAAVPGSRLFLKSAVFDDACGKRCAFEKMERAGIDLARVETEGASRDYLAVYERIDIALDTYPYPGGGTTCDALYMGVPVVSLAGKTHHTRFGKSFLKNAGLGELCAEAPEDYVRIASRLAGDVPRLKQLRQSLRRRLRQSPVLDMTGYMIELEQKYQALYWGWLTQGMDAGRRAQLVAQDEQAFAQAHDARDWERAILFGSRLLWRSDTRQTFADAAGRAYFFLGVPDFARATWCFSQTDLSLPRRQIECTWLLALSEGRRRHHPAAMILYEASIAAYRRYERSPEDCVQFFLDSPMFFSNLLAGAALNALQLGRGEAAAAYYLEAAQRSEEFPVRCGMYGSYLMALHCYVDAPVEMLAAHRRYAAFFSEIRPYDHAHHAHHDRLRIGYISGDFRQHVMFAFYYQLLAGHDAARFEVYTYGCGSSDSYTELVRQAVDVHRDVTGWPMEKVAAQVYADEIDILVDLGGHSSSSGLAVLGWRPAPVQASGLGYMNTTGLGTVDYLLTDRVCDPEGAELFITEQPLYLPSLFCYTGRSDVPVPAGAPCKEAGFVTFGVFNRYEKITDEMLACWREILSAVPGARLLCKAEAYYDDELTDFAYLRFQRAGLDMDRVIFEPSSEDYMQRYLAVDIALDTYPYVGGGTTSDALYMGVPVVTRYGTGRSTRYAYSMLTAVGLPELACASDADYVARAVALARDPELLDALHKNLRPMMLRSALMDTRHYVQALEDGYVAIFDAWRRKGEERG